MKNNLRKSILGMCILIVCIFLQDANQFSSKASESGEESRIDIVYMDLDQISRRFAEGQLNVPEDFRKRLALYQCLVQAVDQYVAENGIEDTFSCELWEGLLYGSREFSVSEWIIDQKGVYEYPLPDIDKSMFTQGGYKLKLEGKDSILYVNIDLHEEKVFIFPSEDVDADHYRMGNASAYAYIRRGENGWPVEYYPDFYVESDWDDLKREDDHFSEVDLDEIESLDFLKVPEDTREYYNVGLYLDVASLLKRYLEENRITGEVFYFDSDKDDISRVTNMIFTCRVRSRNRTLYIDLDAVNMKGHVYQVEE